MQVESWAEWAGKTPRKVGMESLEVRRRGDTFVWQVTGEMSEQSQVELQHGPRPMPASHADKVRDRVSPEKLRDTPGRVCCTTSLRAIPQ